MHMSTTGKLNQTLISRQNLIRWLKDKERDKGECTYALIENNHPLYSFESRLLNELLSLLKILNYPPYTQEYVPR